MPVTRLPLQFRANRIRAAALSIALISWSAAAWADAYDAAFTRAIAAKERALDRNDPAAWEEALNRFEQASQLRETKEVQYELAGAAARLRQDDLAVEGYEAALALGLAGSAREKANAYLAQHRGKVGRLKITGPEGAVVYVRGRRRGALPLKRPLVLFAGPAALRVRYAGRDVERPVQLAARRVSSLDVAPWFVRTSNKRANGSLSSSTSTSQSAVGDGPPPSATSQRPLGWALLASGGGVAVAGTVVVLASGATLSSRRDRLAELCAVPNGRDDCTQAAPGRRAEAQDEVDSIATWKAVRVGGWIGVGLGVAAASTGGVLLLTAPQASTTARVVATPTRGGVSLSVLGTL